MLRVTDGQSRTDTVPCHYIVERAATHLSANPLLPGGLAMGKTELSLKATLTRADGGAPISLQPVAFSAGQTVICNATTDGDGVATCDDLSAVSAALFNLGYRADFPGTPTYQPSTAGAGAL